MQRFRLVWFMLCLSASAGAGHAAHTADTIQPSPVPRAQSKTVEVSRAFAPSIQDANRLHSLPRLDDTLFRIPPFEYNLAARPLIHSSAMRALPAARVGREPNPTYGRCYLKLGLGNYYSPLAELHYGSGYSPGGSFSFDLAHLSSFGHRRLPGGERVRAPQSDTRAGLSGTIALPKVALQAKIQYGHTYHSYYGRSDSAHARMNPLWGTTTAGHRYGLGIAARSTHSDSSHFNYTAKAGLDGYADSRQMVQSHLHAAMSGHMYARKECYGAEMSLDYYHRDFASQKAPNAVFAVHPWIKLFGDRWRIIVGAQLLLDANRGNTYTHLYPAAHFSYDIVQHYFIPYAEVDGGLEVADYLTLLRENRWLAPGLLGWNASRRVRAKAGFRGNLNAQTAFDASVSYALVDSAHFWVNRLVGIPSPITAPQRIYGSDFTLLYDNAERVHARAEIAHAISERYLVGVEMDYWHYTLRRLPSPWHRPKYRILARAAYNLRRKIYAGIYLCLEGGRTAPGADASHLELPMAYDLSLDIRYRFSESLSAFVELRNILGARNLAYHLYPGMRFHGHAGIALHF